MRVHPLAAAVVALSLVLVTATSCGVPDEQVESIDRSELPAGLQEPATTTTTPRDGEVVVAAVHWIMGRGLVAESVLFESGPDVSRLIAVLGRGPARDDDGLRSAVSDGDLVEGVTERDGTAVVELAELTGPDQVLAIGQLVLTLTSLPEVERVMIQRDGEPVDVPLPDGTLVSRPLRAADYSSLLTESAGTRR